MPQTLAVHVEQLGPSASAAHARGHRVLVDRPVAKGGEDRGPLGGEYLLVALGGCFLSNLLAAVRSRDAAVSNVVVDVNGTIDGPPDRFVSLTMSVRAESDDPDVVRKLIAI